MIITYRGWHRDKGDSRIVHAPIDEFSPREESPSEPYPRDWDRAVVFPATFYTFTIRGKEYTQRDGFTKDELLDPLTKQMAGFIVRAKGAVTTNAEHEVDVFLTREEVYLLFLQAFGDLAVREILPPLRKAFECEVASFNSDARARKDKADDRD